MKLQKIHFDLLRNSRECRRLYFDCLIAHLLLFIFFLHIKVEQLLVGNTISTFIYLSGFIRTKNTKKEGFWFSLMAGTVLIDSLLYNLILGWGYGFSVYGLIMIPIMYYFNYIANQDIKKCRLYALGFMVADASSILFLCATDHRFNKFDMVPNEIVGLFFIINLCLCALTAIHYSNEFLTEIKLTTNSLEEKNRELNFRANYDPLTKAYNREQFYCVAEKLIQSNPETQFCMLCSDIKDFKFINDLYGTETGDEVLKLQVKLIREQIQDHAVFGRISGDKFALCMPKVRFDELKVIKNIEKMKAFFKERNYLIHIYVGVYDVTDIYEPIGTMCDKANIAIQNIKGDYHNTIAYFDQELLEHELQKRLMLSEFDESLKSGQFCIYLQPQTDKEGIMYGAEALARWIHPRRGMIMPDTFIECFEQAGLIHRLDTYIWEQAARQLKEWKDAGREEFYISVNISAIDFYYIDIYKTLTDIVKKYEIEPKNLRLELTETALANDSEYNLETIIRLHEEGFLIEIDDFGSGYSSLNMMKDICADVVKIDRKFLSETENKSCSKAILELSIAIANRINMMVITEGVEKQEQVDMLTQMGCDRFQGYYFSKPISIPEFEQKYF